MASCKGIRQCRQGRPHLPSCSRKDSETNGRKSILLTDTGSDARAQLWKWREGKRKDTRQQETKREELQLLCGKTSMYIPLLALTILSIKTLPNLVPKRFNSYRYWLSGKFDCCSMRILDNQGAA